MLMVTAFMTGLWMAAISVTVCIGTRRLYLSGGYCVVIVRAFVALCADCVDISLDIF